MAERGFDAEIIELDTGPTSSIRRRALSLMDSVSANGGLSAESISFVGHSTGGLDIRLLLSPGVRLVEDDREDEVGDLTRSVVSLSTPHFGTPMANFFTSLNGRNLLYALTTLATSEPGRVGAWLGARTMMRLARLDDAFGQRNTVLDAWSEGLFERIRPDRSDELWTYLREVSQDQGAMVQLTPESIDLFNAAVLNRSGVDYVSFVSAAPPPGFPQIPGVGRESAYEAMTFLVFSLCHRLASRASRQYPYPHPGESVNGEIQSQLPFELNAGTNDGVVPTLSQVWGRLGGVYLGDHLDVAGQFSFERDGRNVEGWLHSKSGFDEDRFQALWGDVATAIVSDENVDLRDAAQAAVDAPAPAHN